MLHSILVEELVGGHDIAFKFSFTDFALFVLAKLVLRCDFAVECARVEDLEDDVQNDQESKQAAPCKEQEHCAEEKSPDN